MPSFFMSISMSKAMATATTLSEAESHEAATSKVLQDAWEELILFVLGCVLYQLGSEPSHAFA